MKDQHVHKVAHWPKTSSGSGWGVCECGATIRVYHGRESGDWHACALCVTGGGS